MVNKSTITITFEPTWDSSYMSEEAKIRIRDVYEKDN